MNININFIVFQMRILYKKVSDEIYVLF